MKLLKYSDQCYNLNVFLSRVFKLGSSEPQGYMRTWRGSMRDGGIFSTTVSFLSLELHSLLIRASIIFLKAGFTAWKSLKPFALKDLPFLLLYFHQPCQSSCFSTIATVKSFIRLNYEWNVVFASHLAHSYGICLPLKLKYWFQINSWPIHTLLILQMA